MSSLSTKRNMKLTLDNTISLDDSTSPHHITPLEQEQNTNYKEYVGNYFKTKAVDDGLKDKVKPNPIGKLYKKKVNGVNYRNFGVEHNGYWYKIFQLIDNNDEANNNNKADVLLPMVEREYYYHMKARELISRTEMPLDYQYIDDNPTETIPINFTTPELHGYGCDNENGFCYIQMAVVSSTEYRPFENNDCSSLYRKQIDAIGLFLNSNHIWHNDMHSRNIFVPKTDSSLPIYIIDWGEATDKQGGWNDYFQGGPCAHVKKTKTGGKTKNRKNNNNNRKMTRRRRIKRKRTTATY